jgi:hypothetical protein
MTTVSPGTPLVRLGEMMHLNGTVPRGVDLTQMRARRCRACDGMFLAPRRSRGRFCTDCQTTRRCGACGKVGDHTPRCPQARPRPCRACREELGPGHHHYCDRCREVVCPECKTYGGRHHAACLWLHRARRVLRAHYQGLGPTKMPYQGVVRLEDIQVLYETYRASAVRYAHRLGANGDSEDLVHDVVLWLIERQDYLKQASITKAYFFTSVRRAVLERARGTYMQRTVWVDAQGLVDLEAMTYAQEHGRARTPEVTLPEPIS